MLFLPVQIEDCGGLNEEMFIRLSTETETEDWKTRNQCTTEQNTIVHSADLYSAQVPYDWSWQ